MRLRFAAIIEPSAALIAAISRSTPQSPFNTPQYAAALRLLGATPWALTLNDGETPVAGALALLTRNGSGSRLEIPTAPSLPDPQTFWEGADAWCRNERIDELDVQTFAARAPDLPAFDYPSTRRQRIEYLLNLESEAALSSNHRRNTQKAMRAGLTLVRSRAAADAATHLALVQASLARRRTGGERVAAPDSPELYETLLTCDAGELFMAMLSGTPLASLLALRTATHAYYHSAGANREAFGCGAATWLVSAAAETLRTDGLEQFNLGGTDHDATGLRRFKSGFGTTEVPLEARRFALSSRFARNFKRARAALTRRLGRNP